MKILIRASVVLSFALLLLNLYGLTQSLRPQGLTEDVLRFKENDLKIELNEFESQVKRFSNEVEEEYAERLTYVIANGMAHVIWGEYEPTVFNQTIPIWENYILYFLGTVLKLPEFERYHFTIPEKSIERGVGLCGDASMLMSELLKREGISNTIITVPGHVMVQVEFESGEARLFDPDFGVVLQKDISFYRKNSDELVREYNAYGYINNGELMIRSGLVEEGYQKWKGADHFVTKKYYFERLSYFMIWIIPVGILLLAFFSERLLAFDDLFSRNVKRVFQKENNE
jgi:hypothetical protein